MDAITYPPLDTPKQVAEDVWVVDSGPHEVAGLSLPVRMSVFRLTSGDLILISPTRLTEQLVTSLKELGTIRHLVAPNLAHWSYISAWQAGFPRAICWVAPNLRRRPSAKAKLRIDHELSDAPPAAWRGEVDTVAVRGLGLAEIALFHSASRTLVLTDLIVNLERDKLSAPLAFGAGLMGSLAPSGKAPIYTRFLMRLGGKKAAGAARRLVALQPERVIFAHGTWFQSDATGRLRDALSWLL
ncbi:DUF4336 domain-containing protein (plasmid) [Pelagibacterium sp. H642]|nr:DUF4336 domain-containing protein [Pelagibacterium sp. H642]